MGDYKRLRVWQKAHAVTCATYKITRTFPRIDQFVLGDQLRRAALSIGANIAEGCGRNGDRELRRFLTIALGSANELRYLLEVAIDVGVLDPTEGMRPVRAADDICRMLSGLVRRLSTAEYTRKKRARLAAVPSEKARKADSG
jgi:four helix bundle protein